MAVDIAGVLLIQFAKAPLPGQVKTRMLPFLSAQAAVALHRELVQWTTKQLLNSGLGEVELCVHGDQQDALFGQCLDLGARRIMRQVGADLGERMYNALRTGLITHEKVLLVGSDCPGLDADYLSAAAKALDDASVVIGPATDGGYVLIGAREINREIFRGIAWGSDTVYRQTLSALRCLGVRAAELPLRADIDRPQDLPLWDSLRSAGL